MTVIAIEGMEGFGVSGSASGVDDKHPGSTASGLDLVAGRVSGLGLEFSGTADNLFVGIPDTSEIVIGFGFKIAVLGFERLVFLREGGSNNLGLVINTDGSIDVERTTTVLSSTSAGEIVAGTWYYIEFKGNIHNSTGSYELKIDGVSKTSGSGADTQNSTNAWTDEILFRGRNGTTIVYDDVYILDTVSTPNDDFLGVQIVKAIFPDGDDTANWTPDSGGTNYTQVDDNPHDTDTTYIESSTSTQKDLYDYGDLSGVGDIKCIQVNTLSRETDASDFTLITPVLSNVTETDDSAQAIAGTAYENLLRVLETDPDTGVAWTEAGVDAVRVGVKVG